MISVLLSAHMGSITPIFEHWVSIDIDKDTWEAMSDFEKHEAIEEEAQAFRESLVSVKISDWE